MSSIPVRRGGKAGHSNILKQSENIISRPTSLIIPKNVTFATTTLAEVTSRLTAPTAASLAKAMPTKASEAPPVKKKREVLVEVTKLVTNKDRGSFSKAGGILKGKGKETVKEPQATEEVAPTRAESRIGRPKSAIVQDYVAALNKIANTGRSRPVSLDSGIHLPVSKPTPITEDIIRPSSSQEKEPGSAGSSSKRRVAITEDVGEVERVFKKPCREPSPVQASEPLVFGPVFTKPVEPESEADAVEVARQLSEERATSPDTTEELWDDLDAEDLDDDPTGILVAEYVKDISIYLKELELKTLPNPRYMDFQPDIDWEQRGLIVEWIINIHFRYRFVQESLFLFTNILDRFLTLRRLSLPKFQLAAMACFLIACKYEETLAPSVPEIVEQSEGIFQPEALLKAEQYVLKTINWDLSYPGPMAWLRRISKADHQEQRARTVAKFLMEIGCVEWRLVGTLPSLLAAAAMWLARLVLGRTEWTPNLQHYSTYKEEDLISTASIMLNFIVQPDAPEVFPVLFKKYASKSYYKCSTVLRAWALDRWPNNYDIDLKFYLPWLKADIEQEQEAERLQQEYEDDVF